MQGACVSIPGRGTKIPHDARCGQKKKKKKKKPDTKDHLKHIIPFICNVLNREIYRETTTEDEMAGWHHRLNGHEFG